MLLVYQKKVYNNTMLPRFYLPNITPVDEKIQINDQEIIYQIDKILRLKKNDIFIAFTINTEYELVIKSLEKDKLVAEILEVKTPDKDPDTKVILYQSLLKKDKFEWILQKSVELGVYKIVPIISDNSIIREISDHKKNRYLKIIKEATEQCGGQHIPELNKTLTYDQALELSINDDGQKIIAWEGQLNNSLVDKINADEKNIHLFIGPEGGFSPREIESAKNNDFTIVSLGQRILRAETAAIASLSLILLK